MIHFEGTLKRRDFPSVGLWDWLQKSCWVWWDLMGCQEQRWHLPTSRTEPLNSQSRDADAAVSGDAERAGEIQGDLRPKQWQWVNFDALPRLPSGLEEFLIKPQYLSPRDKSLPPKKKNSKKGL
jgi:hypothetical protein